MFDFPNNPSDGDVVVHPNGKQYEWIAASTVWRVVQDDVTTLSNRVAALENSFFLLLE
jgi:uncharacterized protein with HEPN domain